MIKANKLNVELVKTSPVQGVSDDYRKLNKLGKIPTFEGADGYVLSESIAIAVYRKSSTACFLHKMRPFKHSYPCLKTIVENYSHSDLPFLTTYI